MDPDAVRLFDEIASALAPLAEHGTAVPDALASLRAALSSGVADHPAWRTFYRAALSLAAAVRDDQIPTLRAFLEENRDLAGMRESALLS